MNDQNKNEERQSVQLNSWDEFIDPAQETQRMLSTLISNLPGIVYRCLNDRKYTMLFVSKRVKDIFGFEPEDVINNKKFSFADFIHPEDVDRIWVDTQLKLKNKKSFRLDYRIIDLDGNIKWIWEQGVGIFNANGDLLGLEGFMIDVTDRVNLEKKLIKSKNLALLGEFSSAVANQVRNPLGDCLLSAKLMQELLKTMEKEEESNSREMVSTVLRIDLRTKLKGDILNLIKGINNLNVIVTQILNYTKNMKLIFSMQRIDILLKDILSPFKESASINGISIVSDIEKGIMEIEVDAILISQAIQNLIDNSIKQLREGGEIIINVSKLKGSNKNIIITISDSGPGVNEVDIKKLFRPFYTTRASGTGLGLSFAKRVIEAHNGEIWLCGSQKCKNIFNNLCENNKESNSYKISGATFHILLPLKNFKNVIKDRK